MKVTRCTIPDVLLLEPKVFGDDRGFFFESFNSQAFNSATDLSPSFVQDNHSFSKKNVLRGLHYQLSPHAQGKLIRVVKGAIWDVAVDIRKSSFTFGQWIGMELSEHNHKQMWIPAGFAHGFLVLSEFAEILYKSDAYYYPLAERQIAWNDSDIGIKWPQLSTEFVLSNKDKYAGPLSRAELFP